MINGLPLYKMDIAKMKLPILLYHNVVPEEEPGFNRFCVSVERFRCQMKWLDKKGYKTIHPGQLDEYLKAGKQIPNNEIMITFDDGYRDNYQYAYPILKSHGFTATIFLLPDFIDTDRQINGFNFLNLREIDEMGKNGFDFQSHGLAHKPLIYFTDEEVRNDLIAARSMLRKQLESSISFFAYPFGLFNEGTQKVVNEAGYEGAYGGLPKLYSVITDGFGIGRIEVFDNDSILSFAMKVRTGFGFYYYFLKLAGRVKRRIISSFRRK